MLFRKVKNAIIKITNIDVYRHKCGEIVGAKTIEYLGLFSKSKPFYDFDVVNKRVIINNTTDLNIRYTIHDNCD